MSEQPNYFPASSAHWYTRTGQPMHTVEGKDGQPRPTTLREARKLSLVPSVSTILAIMAKPAITNWKVRHGLQAGWEAGRVGAPMEAAVSKMEERLSKAADTGTRWHWIIENALRRLAEGRDSVEYGEMPPAALDAVLGWVTGEFGINYMVEFPFATPEYGGCIDLLAQDAVVDFKTSENPSSWPEHGYQLAGYNRAMGKKECVNLLISTSEPGLIKPVYWSAEKQLANLAVFNAALNLWQIVKQYKGVK
jgi:hypothetical protein